MSISFADVTLKLLDGLGTTCLIFIISWVLSIPLGVLFCRLSLSKNKIISKIMQVFIWVIRGTPLMLQIMVVFYVPGLLFNWPSLPRIVAAIVAIVINYSVYFSEIFRAGYQSISKGQKEAGFVLGLSRIEIFFKVQLLQIIKKIMPPMTNETISLVKDTALARIIAVNEVMLAADKIVGTYAIVWVLFYTAIFYLVVVGIISLLFKGVEKKLNYFEG
ncbi:MAG: amino acid ABC transporter permease [Bacilli bacterium]|jgi:polar amino acid transport system permease protein|nr:amino acid ABC transporter permease [Bacilli bacterium]